MRTDKIALAFAAAVAALLLAAATGSRADTYTYSGTTSPAAVWSRSVDNDKQQPTALSGCGTQVPYSVFGFTVDTTGNYTIQSAASGWDNYTLLYTGAFDAARPLQNAALANDDYNFTSGQAGFGGAALAAGTPYYLVTTGFGNFDYGAFSNSISGAGKIVPLAFSVRLSLEGVGDMGAVAARLDAVTVSFRVPGALSVVSTASAVPIPAGNGSAYGVCVLGAAPSGVYDVAIKGAKSLQVVLSNVTVSAAAPQATVFLPGGDANNDNSVDPTDFGIFVSAYNSDSSVPGSGYDPAADFNYDGVVDPSDFGIFVDEYNHVGQP